MVFSSKSTFSSVDSVILTRKGKVQALLSVDVASSVVLVWTWLLPELQRLPSDVDREETFLHYGYWLDFAGDLESIITEDFGKVTSVQS
ncbi:hypothetical protein STEG23_012650 [Scotinomys teguina]